VSRAAPDAYSVTVDVDRVRFKRHIDAEILERVSCVLAQVRGKRSERPRDSIEQHDTGVPGPGDPYRVVTVEGSGRE
jgi:hypothetical protein